MECSICFRDYDLQIMPMIGSCGHSFCMDCVKKISSKCPNCQRKTFIHPKKNFLAIEMIEHDSKAVKELKEIKAYQERLEQCLSAQKEQDKKIDVLVPTIKDLQTRLEEKSNEKSAAYQMVAVYTKKIENQDEQILKLNVELFEKTMEIFGKDHYIKELEKRLKSEGVAAEYPEACSPMVNKTSQAGDSENHSTSRDQLENNFDKLKMKRKAEVGDEPPSKKISENWPICFDTKDDLDPDDILLYRKIVCGQPISPLVPRHAQ